MSRQITHENDWFDEYYLNGTLILTVVTPSVSPALKEEVLIDSKKYKVSRITIDVERKVHLVYLTESC